VWDARHGEKGTLGPDLSEAWLSSASGELGLFCCWIWVCWLYDFSFFTCIDSWLLSASSYS
jgi:hypothetical protein